MQTIRDRVEDLDNVGTATVVYFHLLKHIGLLLVAMLLCYAIFATVTNAIAAHKVGFDTYTYMLLSLGGKAQTEDSDNSKGELTYYISAWLSLLTIAVWALLHRITTARIINTAANHHKEVTVADYSVLVRNAPLTLS